MALKPRPARHCEPSKPVIASEARQSIFELPKLSLLKRVWLGTMDCRGLWPRSDGGTLTSSAFCIGFFKSHQQLVAAFDDGIQSFFGGFFATPDLFEFFVFNGANLHIVAQADAA